MLREGEIEGFRSSPRLWTWFSFLVPFLLLSEQNHQEHAFPKSDKLVFWVLILIKDYKDNTQCPSLTAPRTLGMHMGVASLKCPSLAAINAFELVQ